LPRRSEVYLLHKVDQGYAERQREEEVFLSDDEEDELGKKFENF